MEKVPADPWGRRRRKSSFLEWSGPEKRNRLEKNRRLGKKGTCDKKIRPPGLPETVGKD